jgi:pimeloyl-ACP methyl ester carboxylesterase
VLRERFFVPDPASGGVTLDAGFKAPPLRAALAELACSFRKRDCPTLDELVARAPAGDGHPVFVVPGFLANDRSMATLHEFLSRIGYDVHGWGMGRNLGPRTCGRRGERLLDHFRRFANAQGRKVSVIGWSLGGNMARQLARHAPERVRRVITLGAPFTGDPRATHASFLYQWLTGQRFTDPDFQQMLEESRLPPPVPATSIYSKSDGIVDWRCCLEPEAAHTENVEVDSGHSGLTANPRALMAVARRLALPE